jgi:hypothetical protein
MTRGHFPQKKVVPAASEFMKSRWPSHREKQGSEQPVLGVHF